MKMILSAILLSLQLIYFFWDVSFSIETWYSILVDSYNFILSEANRFCLHRFEQKSFYTNSTCEAVMKCDKRLISSYLWYYSTSSVLGSWEYNNSAKNFVWVDIKSLWINLTKGSRTNNLQSFLGSPFHAMSNFLKTYFS